MSALATTCQTLADSGLSARLGAGFVGLALLSASASAPRVDQAPSTGYFVAHAAGDYRPPGPPSDPWGPYIQAAASRFDVPQQWIRQVMQVESGGHEYLDGALIVSSAGAMGLMQLEPETYDEMAARYGLGSDPFNPYDNIMAGTGYIHEMYEVYGSPGFLAAYNAGPGRLDDYMDYHQPLPHATTNYVAMIAPQIQGYYPSHRSEADQLALVQDAFPAARRDAVQHGVDATGFVGRRREGRVRAAGPEEAEFLVLRADAPGVAGLAAGCQRLGQLSDRDDRRAVFLTGIGHGLARLLREAATRRISTIGGIAGAPARPGPPSRPAGCGDRARRAV